MQEFIPLVIIQFAVDFHNYRRTNFDAHDVQVDIQIFKELEDIQGPLLFIMLVALGQGIEPDQDLAPSSNP